MLIMPQFSSFIALLVLCVVSVAPTHAVYAEGLEIEIDFETVDANTDGKISKAELNTSLTSILVKQLEGEVGKEQAEEIAQKIIPPTVDQIFTAKDRNLDGFLSKEEMASEGD